MSSLKCSFCGYGIHYHGEPESIEHYFCDLSKWHDLEKENLPSSRIEVEHDYPLTESWKCARCGSFSVFSDYVNVSGVYIPKEEFSSEPMQAPFEFGPFWDDHLWFDIAEIDIPTSEILTKFPQNLWLAKNEDEMRIYKDKARTKCVGQFRRFHMPDRITVQTMSLKAFKKILVTWDDIEFKYNGIYYNFIKESLIEGQIKIDVWRGYNQDYSCYSIIVNNGDDFVENLINAKIFDDGKSIAEAQKEILL